MTINLPQLIHAPGLPADPLWYKSAVFYEVMVRSFFDSNGDGYSDLSGLISKLDYLQWLGVDALWIPPIFQSPLRDGGYDVADYTDLNYANPAVQEAVFEVVRFWLSFGVDGFRLDAVPYLFASDDGNGESEPATHEFLRQLRRMMDREYPGRILIAEANQWPQETAAYFGSSDEPECHMAIDFLVMPRIFYSLRSQSTQELQRVLSETTLVPQSAAWGVFLRNHDELTLEMVSEEYRQAMYGWYAYDPRMRVNLGLRRRLAPLLDNSRAELELTHALLLALPGAPFLYYGDEIGMGDNIWLEDRDSSRTPMQWSPDRNAGFSMADHGKLYLPVVQSLVYNYALVNVESQLSQSRSLLHWIRNSLSVRRGHPAFGLGNIQVLESDHDSVIAFTRGYPGNVHRNEPAERVLCAFSFNYSPVSATIELVPQDRNLALTDLYGGNSFPPSNDQGLLTLTFGPQSFYWLQIGQK